jgi:hypothetical protein
MAQGAQQDETGDVPASATQLRYIRDLGASEIPEGITRKQASAWITALKSAALKPPHDRDPALLTGPPGWTDVQATTASKALAPGAHESPEFISGTAAISPFLVRPEVGIEEAKKVWEAFKEFKTYLLSDKECYDEIEGSKEMNRTGATRLAIPFGLSIEERSIEETQFSGEKDARFIVRVRVSKGARFVDAIGTARLSEIPEKTKEKGRPGEQNYRPPKDVTLGQREHFAYTRAWTRAAKRGIADLLGGTEAE